MEQVNKHIKQRDNNRYSIVFNVMNLLTKRIKLIVLSQFFSPEPLQFNCFHKIAIRLIWIVNYEQTTELNNA